MTITAQSVCRRVATVLQDLTSVRWTLNEVVRALNDGQRDILLQRPDLFSVPATMLCVAGAKQSIPAGGIELIDVLANNTATSKRSVRLVSREVLDANAPGWRGYTQAAEVVHFMFDPRDKKTFYVYPPASVSAKLDLLYAAPPTDIAEPGDGTSLPISSSGDAAPSTVIGNIGVPDDLATALQDFMLYRLYMKDANYAGNVQRAAAHYQAYATALGMDVKAALAVGPSSAAVGNPNSLSPTGP